MLNAALMNFYGLSLGFLWPHFGELIFGKEEGDCKSNKVFIIISSRIYDILSALNTKTYNLFNEDDRVPPTEHAGYYLF